MDDGTEKVTGAVDAGTADAEARDAEARLARVSAIERAALLGGAGKWTTHAVPNAQVPAMTLADGPHGVRLERMDAETDGDDSGGAAHANDTRPSLPATCFPTASVVACSWDPRLATLMGQTIAAEARAQGVHVLLGPGMNVKRSPRCGRNFEYYSEDPQLAGRMAAGFVDGVQSRGVAACPKHFAANGQELRRQSSDSVVDERTLRELYLTAFEIAVREAHPWAIMTSYNRINGTYAFENRHLLRDVLRGEWSFDGMVVSDWGGSNDAVAAAAAGGSLEMPCPGLASVRELAAAVRDGRLDEAELTARAAEVARCAERTHAGDAAGTGEAAGVGDGAGESPTDAPAALSADDLAMHHRLAMRVAEESAVLLRNGDPRSVGAQAAQPPLPFAHGTRVALVGEMAARPRFQGGGSSRVNATRVESLRDVLEQASEGALALAAYAQGYRAGGAVAGSDGTADAKNTDTENADVKNTDAALIREACALADRPDVDAIVACVGLDDRSEAEGVDRATLAMPQPQNDLMAALADAAHRAGKPLVAVLTAGSPVLLPWADACDAILYVGLGGQAVAAATARLLCGLASPSGRLAETWPLAEEDVPVPDYPARGERAVYAEGMLTGYRHYVTAGVPVRFPFGFGLTYTRFALSDLAVDATGVQVTVTNVGDRAGAAVPQLYVAARGSDADVAGGDDAAGAGAGSGAADGSPARELRGFAKVWLAPGESTRVSIAFDRYTFRRWVPAKGVGGGTDNVAAGMWRDDAMGRTVIVGEDCTDVRLTGVTPGSEASRALRVLEGTTRLDVDLRALANAARIAAGSSDAETPSRAGAEASQTEASQTETSPTSYADASHAESPSAASGSASPAPPTLTVNSPFSDWAHSPSRVARWWARRLERQAREAQERNGGVPDLDALFKLNMPPRALAKLSDGAVDPAAAASLARIGQGHAVRGAIGFAWHVLCNRIANARIRRALRRLGVD
ncbi:beta-glucosidase family protein [Bifidobacterium moraviense]|nr:glycoside hydrolase family 3 N-terminal domain-containing protein [Bifidobacterium sp. DSM 109958]